MSFIVEQRSETTVESAQLENIKKYAIFTKLPHNKLQPYLYHCLNNEAYRPNAPDKIAKVVHQIWIGTSAISGIRAKLHETIIKHHPDYSILLWQDRNITKINFPLTTPIITRSL
jgi:mannosyltransferase OCH1-like enzyme